MFAPHELLQYDLGWLKADFKSCAFLAYVLGVSGGANGITRRFITDDIAKMAAREQGPVS